MNEWVGALTFGVALVAFVLGLSSIIMGASANGDSGTVMQERVEYGFFGVTGLVVCLLMVYVMA